MIGSAVTAIAALGGVLLAQRGTRRQDLDGRIWECRSRAYEELVKWVLVIRRAADGSAPADDAAVPTRLAADQLRALLPSPDLEARVTAYASAAVLRDFRRCCNLLSRPSQRRDTSEDALLAVSGLGDDIRKELRTGREQMEPLAFRIESALLIARIVLLPSPRRWRQWRRYRALEQEDEVLLTSQDTV